MGWLMIFQNLTLIYQTKIIVDDEATAEYSQSTLEEVETAKNDVKPTNMPGTSQIHHKTD